MKDFSNAKRILGVFQGECSHLVYKEGEAYYSVITPDNGEVPTIMSIHKGLAHHKPEGVFLKDGKKTLYFYEKLFSNIEIRQVLFSDGKMVYSAPFREFMKKTFLIASEDLLTRYLYVHTENLSEFAL